MYLSYVFIPGRLIDLCVPKHLIIIKILTAFEDTSRSRLGAELQVQ